MLDAQGVLAELAEIVADKGSDYLYRDEEGNLASGSDCIYFYSNGQPGCIVGHLLARHGVTIEQMFDADGNSVNETTSVTGLANLVRSGLFDADDLPLDIDDRVAMAALSAAQEEQDTGHTWGEALASAQAAVQLQESF